MRPVLKAAIGSIAAGALILACNLAAAKISGSTALFSDALETLVNLLSSGLALSTFGGALNGLLDAPRRR